MTAPSSSRLTAARRRLRVAKFAIVAVVAAGFAGGVAATRASHPATRGHTSAVTQQPAESSSDEFAYGGGSYIAPATSAPSIQSGGS